MFEISTLKFVVSESLTHTVNFGIGSAFCKGSESAFLNVQVRVRVHFLKYAPFGVPQSAFIPCKTIEVLLFRLKTKNQKSSERFLWQTERSFYIYL